MIIHRDLMKNLKNLIIVSLRNTLIYKKPMCVGSKTLFKKSTIRAFKESQYIFMDKGFSTKLMESMNTLDIRLDAGVIIEN